jgi:hypothetical protein
MNDEQRRGKIMQASPVPPEFQAVFRELVAVFPARGLTAETIAAYHAVLGAVPVSVLRAAARQLARTNTFFPSTGEWFTAANVIQAHTVPAEGSRRLEELDDLAPNDPERDEISKGLSRDDQRALMARYGFTW